MPAPTSALPDVPFDADEATTLTTFLDYNRMVLRRKAEGINAEELSRTTSASTMTIGGILSHMTAVETYWFDAIFVGDQAAVDTVITSFKGDADWDWRARSGGHPEALLAAYDAAVTRSQTVTTEALLSARGLDSLASRKRHGHPVNLRWILVHMIEEHARHAGHADLLREEIDGQTAD